MPLDHVNGEDIGRLGRGDVVEISKWADTPMFSLACDAAERAFIKAGGILPIEFESQEVLVMEYPRQDRLAFVFCKHVAGKEQLFPWVVHFKPDALAELRMTGRWRTLN